MTSHRLPSKITHRLCFIAITTWMSVCLFIAGWLPESEDWFRQTWATTGAVGLIACLGLSQILFVEIRENARLIREYEIQAFTDPLTNLTNRRGFDRRLNELLKDEKFQRPTRYERGIFLALIDVDKFKQINDGNGHSAGDRMLEYLAQTIYEYVPEKSMAARLGGDEFAILFINAPPELVVWSLKTIRQQVDDGSRLRDDLVHTTVSVGLTNLNYADTYESIFNRADRALYKTKDAGRNKITFR